MADKERLTEENRQLQLAVTELKVLNDIATTISSTQPVEEIIDQIVLKCIRHLGIEEGTISLLESGSADDRFRTMIRRQDTSATKLPIRLDDRLKGWMLKNRSILLSNNIEEDDRFSFIRDGTINFKSLLCVPLMAKGDLIGYLAAFNKKNGGVFTDEDRRLLSIIGSQSAQVIENARLYEEEKALMSLQEEMKMAREIQLRLLPASPPEYPGIQISAFNIPAKSVGGDYYDFIRLPSGRLGICIGDITGKGMPAAMLMANLQATFRSQAVILEQCDQCLQGTNTMLFRSTEATKFATFFYGILDPESNMLTYANGGHDAPLLLYGSNENEPAQLGATGLLLGVMENAEYELQSVDFKAGDILLLYTDGITEAMDKEGQEFGLDELVRILRLQRDQPAETICKSIVEEVATHTAGTPQSDDITLMVIKRSHTS